jgi:hypothetical protein
MVVSVSLKVRRISRTCAAVSPVCVAQYLSIAMAHLSTQL